MPTIYALTDPDTGEIRYIGKANDAHQRFMKHLRPSSLRSPTYKNRWIAGLLARGERPGLTVLEECLDSEWAERERVHIEFARLVGLRLTNTTSGGEGLRDYVPTEATRRKVSKSLKGQKRPEMAARMRGRPAPWMYGNTNRSGATLSAESRAQIAAKKRGVPQSPETIAKRVAAITGKKRSPETRALLAELGRARHARGDIAPMRRNALGQFVKKA